jgi:transcriptional regulator with XRE-family HTH domain
VRPSPSPAVRQLQEQLAARLRSLRTSAGLSGRQLAEFTRWAPSKVSKIEHVNQLPTAEDVRAWLAACDKTVELPEFLAQLNAVEGMYVEWSRVHRTGLSSHQKAYRRLDKHTRHYRVYEAGVIPGFLQTPDYAESRLAFITEHKGLPADDVSATVAARMERQKVLSGAVRFAFLLEEAALRSRIGEVDMMIGQLAHLIAVSSKVNIALMIIPQYVDRTWWSSPGFWIYDSERVIIEIPSAELTITHPSEVAVYERAFASMSEMAVTGQQAREVILREISALEKL